MKTRSGRWLCFSRFGFPEAAGPRPPPAAAALVRPRRFASAAALDTPFFPNLQTAAERFDSIAVF